MGSGHGKSSLENLDKFKGVYAEYGISVFTTK